MNNLEKECVDVLTDFLFNRPKDIKERYRQIDREKCLEILYSNLDNVMMQRKSIGETSYSVLKSLYDVAIKMFEKNIL